MSTLATQPNELRPLVHREVDELNGAELDAVHRMILRMRMEKCLEQLDEAADEARAAGRYEMIEQFIREHRERHPYQ